MRVRFDPKNEPSDLEDIRPVQRDINVSGEPSEDEASSGFYVVALTMAVVLLLGVIAYVCQGLR